MVEEARLEQFEMGLAPVTDGWFVVSVRDGAWVTNESLGAACIFEGDDAPFPEVGFTLGVLRPGRPSGMYHREANQENFLVLSGECLLLIEGQERRLGPWDFVHCPAGTKRVIVGAGDRPCLVFAVGARANTMAVQPDGTLGAPPDWGGYPVDEAAIRHGAGVEEETADASVAYARFPDPESIRYEEGLLPW